MSTYSYLERQGIIGIALMFERARSFRPLSRIGVQRRTQLVGRLLFFVCQKIDVARSLFSVYADQNKHWWPTLVDG